MTSHNSDIIIAEYRMSDGKPYQASHFREQNNPWIGLMDPAFAYGETHYPNYFSTADKNMFDAIGYDYPPCVVPQFTQQPPSQNGCVGGTVQMCVAVVNIPLPPIQWRTGTNNLVDDGVHILGATTSTSDDRRPDPRRRQRPVQLPRDQHGRWLHAPASGNVGVYVPRPVAFTGQPTSQTVLTSFSIAVFGVTATGEPPLTLSVAPQRREPERRRHISGARIRPALVIFGACRPHRPATTTASSPTCAAPWRAPPPT